MSHDIPVRPMQADDIDGVLQVQQQAYGAACHESAAVLLARWQRAPSCCLVAGAAGEVLAYIFSHPWHQVVPPRLHQMLPAVPPDSDRWFVHDLAVGRAARGQGLALRLWQQARHAAAQLGCRDSLLVALQEAHGFWLRQGYVPVPPGCAETRAVLQLYGDGATLMRRLSLA